MRHAPIGSIGIGLAVVLAALAGVVAAPAGRVQAASPQSIQPDDGLPPPGGPEKSRPSGGQPTGNGNGGTSIVNQVTNITQDIIQFQYDTLADAITRMSANMSKQAYGAASGVFSGALELMITGQYGLAPQASGDLPLFTDLIYPHWQVTFTLALLLLPATLVMTAAAAMRQGAASVLSYADMKEALVGWFIALGAAAASYYLLSLVFKLSVAAAHAVAAVSVAGTPSLTGSLLANVLFDPSLLTALAVTLSALSPSFFPLLMLVGFFALFLACTIVLGLGLALAAFTALAYLVTTLAPLVFVLSTLPPLRWLRDLWLKQLVMVALLPVADMLLLKAAETIGHNLEQASGANMFGQILCAVCIAAGIISVLIAINFKVAETTFGALGQALSHASETAAGLTQMAAGAVALVAGGAALLGGATATGAATAGAAAGATGAPTATTCGTPALAGPSGASGAPTAPGQSSQTGVPAGSASARAQVTPAEVAARLASGGAGGSAASGNAPDSGTASDLAAPSSPDSAKAMASVAGGSAGSSPSGTQAPAGGSAVASAAAAGNASASKAPARARSPNTAARRAQLAQTFGWMLTRSRDPLNRTVGQGLYAASALMGSMASAARDDLHLARAAEADDRYQLAQQQRAAHEAKLDTRYHDGQHLRAEQRAQFEDQRALAQAQSSDREAISWADRYRQNPTLPVPAAVLAPNHPMDNLLAGLALGALQNEGYSAPLPQIRAVVDQTYGFWRDHGEANSGAAGMQIRRDLCVAFSDPARVQNPTTLLRAELDRVALDQQIEFGPDLPRALDNLDHSFHSLAPGLQARSLEPSA